MLVYANLRPQEEELIAFSILIIQIRTKQRSKLIINVIYIPVQPSFQVETNKR